MDLLSSLDHDAPRIEVAIVPASSDYAHEVAKAAEACGIDFVAVDAATPADLVERVVVVDLSRAVVAQQLGRRVIAISANQKLDCFDVIHPNEVRFRLARSLRNLVELETLRARVAEGEETVQLLNEIGLALSAITDQDDLLQEILSHARRVLYADGGTIYMRDGDELIFTAAQNDTIPIKQIEKTRLPIQDQSLAGFVAGRKTVLNIDDTYSIPEAMPYRPNFSFDKASGYHTRSMLLVPMTDRDDEALGVLALMNRKPIAGAPIADYSICRPFSNKDASLAKSIASQAAVALENYRLYQNIRNLFDSFIVASVTVIEARDPSTAGHSQRVADLTVELARECEVSGLYNGVSFTPDQIEEIRYASLLHDFGKVGVREEVLLKANKLHPWELERVEWRFRLAAVQAELEHLRRGTFSHDERMAQLERDIDLVRRMNSPRYRFTEGDTESLAAIAGRWMLSVEGEPVLEEREISRLCIPYGSLDQKERLEIQRHVEHTYQFLKVIPWTSNLSAIPHLAYAHHEKLDGSGYPRGLLRSEIPLGARLMTISDIFDALTAGDRPYKASMPIERAVSILRAEVEAGHLENDAVELFVAREVWRKIGIS